MDVALKDVAAHFRPLATKRSAVLSEEVPFAAVTHKRPPSSDLVHVFLSNLNVMLTRPNTSLHLAKHGKLSTTHGEGMINNNAGQFEAAPAIGC